MASEAVTEAHDCKSFGDDYGGGARRREGKGRGRTTILATGMETMVTGSEGGAAAGHGAASGGWSGARDDGRTQHRPPLPPFIFLILFVLIFCIFLARMKVMGESMAEFEIEEWGGWGEDQWGGLGDSGEVKEKMIGI
ncbi:hypothetical protein SESBI_21840 [Sesbania bispinosa]|nr:hypothetical protein SESBI_21840 [Sesbania bispinosa]